MTQSKNIHVLSTYKPSRLFYDIAVDKLKLSSYTTEPSVWFSNKHIYITSDEEINDGNWCIDTYKLKNNHNPIFKWSDKFKVDAKKIILTTDPDLIKDGVQSIDDEFLEWFVKNPSCEEVEVEEMEKYKPTTYDQPDKFIGYEYKIIIPKEEPKKYPIGGYAPGSYSCKCITCNNMFMGDKRAVRCEPCAIETTQEEPKQETIEETAGKSFEEIWASLTTEQSEYLKDYINKQMYQAKKWQAERMYSEEEVELLLHKFMQSEKPNWHGYSTTKWFEQFKKK